jgi:hypothetical protein
MKYYIATIGGSHEIVYSDEYSFDKDEMERWLYQGDGESCFASKDYEITKKAYLVAMQKMLDTVGWAITNLPSKEDLKLNAST